MEDDPWFKREVGEPSANNPSISLAKVGRLLLAVVVGVVIAWFVYPYTPSGAQYRNLAIAEERAPGIEKVLHEEVRFKHVQVGKYTGGGGMIGLYGSVYGGEEDLRVLKEKMRAMKLPLSVNYQVQVYELTDEEKERMRGK